MYFTSENTLRWILKVEVGGDIFTEEPSRHFFHILRGYDLLFRISGLNFTPQLSTTCWLPSLPLIHASAQLKRLSGKTCHSPPNASTYKFSYSETGGYKWLSTPMLWPSRWWHCSLLGAYQCVRETDWLRLQDMLERPSKLHNLVVV
jgi:hypothetical protein